MAGNDLSELSITELAPRIAAREVSPVEVTRAALARAERMQPLLNSFITLLPEQAIAQAEAREEAIGKGEYRGPLDGVPIGIKDNIATAGIRSTVGSKVLADFVPAEDARVVELCKQAGAIILGKENMHEFAAGGTSDNPHYGPVRNPWNRDRIPGGSSGGSAANVVTGVTYASLGTDLGGSVRGPAAFCGAVGFKQTFGRVSQRGLMVTSFNGDHIGPITRTVADNAAMLQVMAGIDPLDPSTVPVPVPDYSAGLGRGIAGVRVGVPSNYFFDIVDTEVRAALDRAINSLKEFGAELVEVSFQTLQYAEVLQALFVPEGVVVHEQFLKNHREAYSEDLAQRMLAGQFVLARDFIKGMKVQRLIKEEFAAVLQQVDLIAAPTTICPAFPIGAETVTIEGKEYPLKGPGATVTGRATFLANATGLPSLSVPCGFSSDGLPFSLQLIGRPFEEEVLLQAASSYEQVSPSRGVWPPVVAG